MTVAYLPTADVVAHFADAIRAAGLEPPANIEADGQLHRFKTGPKGRDKAGFYALHLDGTPAGFFGCWRGGLYSTWSARGGERLNDGERARLRAAIAAAEAERDRRHAERASFAAEIYNSATEAPADHRYLTAKQIAPAGAIRYAPSIDRAAWFDDSTKAGSLTECLLLPVMNEAGQIQSLQAIDPTGNKLFLSGAKLAGGMFEIPGKTRFAFVAEGYATAATVAAATGTTTLVAFNAGNLRAVAEAARRRYPEAQLVIAADNDHAKEHNRGLEAGQEAAEATGALMVAPGFAATQAGKDWNDYAAELGGQAVAEAIRGQLEVARAATATAANDNEPEPIQPAQPAQTGRPPFGFVRVDELLENLAPVDWLVRGYVERDSLAVIYGEPGHGKSFLAIDLACSVATGSAWHGRQVKQGPVFYIAGEGHNGLGRRFAAWGLARGVSLSGAPLYKSERAAAFTDAMSALEVARAVQELATATGQAPALIIVDTLARNFGPADENSAADMTAFVANLDGLRHRWQATVAIVHHSGKDASKGARGSSALRGAADAEYEVARDELGTIRMEAHKMKDAETPAPLAFKLASVALPLKDEDGEQVKGAALQCVDYLEPPRNGKSGRGKNQTKALEVLADLLRENEQRLESGGRDPAGARVSLDQWRDRLESAGIDRRRFYDVKTSLLESGKIEMEAGGYVRPY